MTKNDWKEMKAEMYKEAETFLKNRPTSKQARFNCILEYAKKIESYANCMMPHRQHGWALGFCHAATNHSIFEFNGEFAEGYEKGWYDCLEMMEEAANC